LRRTACGELQIDPLAPRERRCYKASICATRQYGWGNLLNITATKCQVNQTNLSLNSSNPSSNQISGWSYDAAGNTLNTGAGTESYTWNAEERMATVASSLYGDDTYVYDGDGERVKKASGKVYWHGAGGEVLAESDLGGNVTAEYVFFDGERLARIDASGSVDYYLSDKLGSSAVVTDSGGNVLDDSDFLPFGDELDFASSSGNTYKYTGLERDADQLDHTLNRQYSSNFGRWMTPDPGGVKVVKLDNPQTWNMYAYALDNPTTLNDPSGLYTWARTCDQGDTACQERRQEFRNALTDVAKARNTFNPKSKAYKGLSRVLAAYGTEGKGGPAIAFGKVAKGFGGNFNSATNTVTLDLARYGSSSLGQLNFGTLVAHEGEHYADRALTMARSQYEYRGYEATSWTAQGEGLGSWTGIPPDRGVLWNSTTSAPGANFNKGFLQIWQQIYEPLYPGPVVMPYDPFPND